MARALDPLIEGEAGDIKSVSPSTICPIALEQKSRHKQAASIFEIKSLGY